ncbi:CPBP family glutamic-type intramembrane protease [Methanobacterium arcticum]|jgi:membrane protease YdiL (CAAX protease family)|nr:CPBP family glutamic-type intramembrane protease [Methanobacterium arcticum]
MDKMSDGNNDKNSYRLLENYNNLLEQFGKLKNGHMAAKVLVRIGDLYRDLMNHGKAMENYNLALKLFHDEDDTWGEAFTLESMGNLWKSAKVYSEARKFYQQSLENFQVIGNWEMEKNILNRISGCYLAEGSIEDALDVHKKIDELPLDVAQFFINQVHIKRLLNEIGGIRPTRAQSLTLISYSLILILSELVTTYYMTSWGIILHVILISSLVINSTLTKSVKFSYLLQAMILLPLIRIMSLSIPVMELEPLYWLALMSVPVLAAVWMLMQGQCLSRKIVGLNSRNLILQLLVGLTGLGFGFVEYLILQPTALISNLSPVNVIFAGSIVIISTGLLEELVFRGIIQRNAENIMGKVWGIIFTSLLFVGFNISWNSPMDLLFIFGVSIFYGYIFQKTRSILGISVSHGICNVVLFIILPFFLI